ncbi:MAG: substrate-binding domain-containing protein [Chitinophagaceae bacterium]|nr:substrate-binding domain-containing protein [Chitinophagaceae bacterium]
MSKIAMMWRYKNISALVLSAVLWGSCGQDSSVPKVTDSPTSGVLNMSVDETYQPVMEEEVKVFASSYPEATINVRYVPEADAIQDFMAGKSKLIIVSRELTEKESEFCLSNKIVPSSLVLAKDAVAIVLHKSAKDTTFTKSQLQKMIAGELGEQTIVFDNAGSSTLKFITDSIMKGKALGKNIFAAKSNEAVIAYVKKNPNAVGFVGLSFVSDTMDSTSERFNTAIKVAGVLNDSTLEYYQPYQADIALKLYPLVRKMTYIKNETYQGIASGFSNFLAYDKGQLILGKARLVPMRMSIVVRDAAVNTD